MRLRVLLAAHGVKQDEVAADLGITRSAISHYVAGRRTPSPTQVRRIYALLAEKAVGEGRAA